MTISKPIRWSLIAIAGVLVLFVSPMVLFTASNAGVAVMSLILNRQPTPKELFGKYSYDASWGNSSLELKSDGTFRQDIGEAGKPVRTITGRWSSQPSTNSTGIDLTPFGMVWDEDHATTTGTYRMDFYKPHLGRTYGVINDDLGEQYKREQ